MADQRRNANRHYSLENSFYVVEAYSIIGTCDKQEDVFECVEQDMGMVLVLCDGMGGLGNGRVAAEKAVSEIKQFALEQDWKSNPREFLRKAIEIADEEVYFLKNPEGKQLRAGCTVLIALIAGRKVYYANVGDSRIYYYDGNCLSQVTQDHNYGEQLERQLKCGEITREIYEREQSKAAALTGYLGLGEIKERYIAEEPILLDRNHVLCLQSDGLYKLLSEKEMLEIIARNPKDLSRVGEGLLQKADEKKSSYQDNTSIILLRLK